MRDRKSSHFLLKTPELRAKRRSECGIRLSWVIAQTPGLTSGAGRWNFLPADIRKWRTAIRFARKNIGSEIDKNLREKIDKPIVFKYFYTGSESRLNAGPGVTVHGIETSVFIEILRSILKAKLTQTQEFLGDRAQAMLIALANTTLDTILYQESGFWEAVEGQRVAEILDKHLQEHARKWAKTFPLGQRYCL